MHDEQGIPNNDLIADLRITEVEGLIDMTGHRTINSADGSYKAVDVTFAPGQVIKGFVDVSNIGSLKRQRLMENGAKMSERFSVLFVGQMMVFEAAKRTGFKAMNGAGYASTLFGLELLMIIPGVSGLFSKGGKGNKNGDGKSILVCSVEVPVDDNGSFELRIPDTAIIPPGFQSEFANVSYTICAISRSKSVIGQQYQVIMDGNVYARQLVPQSLRLAPPPASIAFGVISDIINVQASVASDRVDFSCTPDKRYDAVVGSQAVHVQMSVDHSNPAFSGRISSLADLFCDVTVHFLHKFSFKDGKHASDFTTKDVAARTSLRPLTTGGTSTIEVNLNLELRRHECGPQRVAGPFYIYNENGKTLCVPTRLENADAALNDGDNDAEHGAKGDKTARYVAASEWFVVVKVAVTDDGKKKKEVGGNIALRVPFSAFLRRSLFASADYLPTYS
ncbi:hypothetical protein BJ742DRAFT_801229 [Cladochytrium replicatum]|nr:hypothetical protein BJ742DRAFT_801229 [Cladochytrium replicatum]